MFLNRTFKYINIVPNSCSEVAVVTFKEDFGLEKVIEQVIGNKVFYTTKYLIVRQNEGEFKEDEPIILLKVITTGEGLMRTINQVEVLAKPNESVVVIDRNVDEYYSSHVVLKALSIKARKNVKAIVISGRNHNVTFAYLEDIQLSLPLKLLLVDVVPPRPSRLNFLSNILQKMSALKKHIHLELVEIDLTKIIREASREGLTYTTCFDNEIGMNNVITDVYLLKKIVSEGNLKCINIVGCELLLHTLKELNYFNEVKLNLWDVCPFHRAVKMMDRIEADVLIVRCCKAKSNVRVLTGYSKTLALLPWPTQLEDFLKALTEVIKVMLKVRAD